MKNLIKVTFAILLLAGLNACTEESVLVEIGEGSPNQMQDPTENSILSTYEYELSLASTSEAKVTVNYTEAGLLTSVLQSFVFNQAPLQIQNESTLTFNRNNDNQIESIVERTVESGNVTTSNSTVEYGMDNQVSAITYTNNGTSYTTTLAHTANTTVAEIDNEMGQAVAKLTLTFNNAGFPTNALLEDLSNNNNTQSTITLNSGNIVAIENRSNGNVVSNQTFAYDQNINPLGNANYNAADNQMILLHSFASSTLNDGVVDLDESFFDGYEIFSANNLTSATREDGTINFDYTYSTAMLPISAALSISGQTPSAGNVTYTYYQ